MTEPLERLRTALADRYHSHRELGRGVDLADDLRHERKVALKVLRPELSTIIGEERFLHEISPRLASGSGVRSKNRPSGATSKLVKPDGPQVPEIDLDGGSIAKMGMK